MLPHPIDGTGLPLSVFRMSAEFMAFCEGADVRTTGDMLVQFAGGVDLESAVETRVWEEFAKLLDAIGLALPALPGLSDIPIERLGLQKRIQNICVNDGIATVGDLTKRTVSEMSRVPNCGPVAVNDLRLVLGRLGLSFAEQERLGEADSDFIRRVQKSVRILGDGRPPQETE